MRHCLAESTLANNGGESGNHIKDGGESGNHIKDGGDDGEDDDPNIDDT